MIIMILIFVGAGIYLFLVSLGFFHQEFQRELDRKRRTAIRIFGIGLLGVGLLNIFYFYQGMERARVETERLKNERKEIQITP